MDTVVQWVQYWPVSGSVFIKLIIFYLIIRLEIWQDSYTVYSQTL